MAVPYTFAGATSSIPLSQLDTNFASTITLGNTAIQLGNTVTTLNNMTLANVTISSGNVTITNVSVTTANVTTGNITTLTSTNATLTNMSSGNVTITGGTINGTTLGATTASSANVTTLTTSSTVTLNGGTANGVAYLNGSKVLTTGSALTFDGTTLGVATGVANSTSLQITGAYTTNNNATFISFLRAGGAVAGALRYNDTQGDIEFGTTTSHPIAFIYGGTEAMRLTSTGLGIGTSLPTSRLTIGSGSFASAAAQTTGMYTNGSNGLVILTDALNVGGRGGGDRLVLDSSGNLGLGVTPSAWASGYTALQIENSALMANGNDVWFYANGYFDGGANRYIGTGYASRYVQTSGQHQWMTAPSWDGTGSNAISFSQVMTLDASGQLMVGKNSNSYGDASTKTFEISGSSSSIVALQYGGANGYYLQVNSTAGYLWNSANTPIVFGTNNTERARITSGGSVVVGTAAIATNATDGFLYVPTCAGTPTGTPTTQTGTAPIVIDTTNNKLYFYSGGQWRDAGP